MTQVVEHLSSKHKVLSSNHTIKKKRGQKGQRADTFHVGEIWFITSANEISQTQSDKYCKILLLWSSYNKFIENRSESQGSGIRRG
jgi:hypothetical protein